jgi:hypothetical protein
MQQLHGFDELRNNKRMIQNLKAKMNQAVVSSYLSNFLNVYLRLAEKIERMKNGENHVFWPFEWR